MKNKSVIFLIATCVFFLAGSCFVKIAKAKELSPGDGCGTNWTGICTSGTSCPSGMTAVLEGADTCMSGYSCCKDSTSSSTLTKGIEEPDSPSVSYLGKIDIPEGTGLPDNTIAGVLSNILTWLLGIIGILAIMGFVISGIQYLLAYSNEDLAESAKKNMTYSIIGITVALASYIIIQAINLALSGTSWF